MGPAGRARYGRFAGPAMTTGEQIAVRVRVCVQKKLPTVSRVYRPIIE